MTYEEYQRRREELLNAETELAEEFVRDNPFNQFVGKKVRINGGEIGFYEIPFVHELQYSLKDCKLFELAENFKVE